jgi:hypothetical protein
MVVCACKYFQNSVWQSQTGQDHSCWSSVLAYDCHRDLYRPSSTSGAKDSRPCRDPAACYHIEGAFHFPLHAGKFVSGARMSHVAKLR